MQAKLQSVLCATNIIIYPYSPLLWAMNVHKSRAVGGGGDKVAVLIRTEVEKKEFDSAFH